MTVAGETTTSQVAQTGRRSLFRSPMMGAGVTLVIVFVLFSIFVPEFLTMRSISGIINAATLTGIIAIGVTLLMIAGEFDLSVGPVMAMGGFVFGFYVMGGVNSWLAIVIALVVCMFMGLFNGFVVVRARMPSFIVTLGTAFLFTGVVWAYSGGQVLQITDDMPIFAVLNGRMEALAAWIPGANFRTSIFWLLGLVAFFQFILVRTRFGNHIFAVGGNRDAAAAQGVAVGRVKTICFMITSVLAGLAGVFLFAQFKTVRIATGTGEELKAIAAAVVGGTLITGGYGSVVGTLIGVLLISTLRTGVVLMDVISADNFDAIVGVTIVAAAILNNYLRNRG
jgi:simple sugar transport system permease protein